MTYTQQQHEGWDKDDAGMPDSPEWLQWGLKRKGRILFLTSRVKLARAETRY